MEEEEAVRKADEEERRKREPEMATTPAPEAVEMDVVVSENSAVVTAAVDSISEWRQTWPAPLAAPSRGYQAQVLEHWSTSGHTHHSRAGGAHSQERHTPQSEANRSQQVLQNSISALQELLLGQIPPTSLSTVLQSFSQGGYPSAASSSAVSAACLLYTSPSPRDRTRSRMPSSA